VKAIVVSHQLLQVSHEELLPVFHVIMMDYAGNGHIHVTAADQNKALQGTGS